MLGSRHEIASLQSDFYREQFRKMLHWLMISLFIIFILIVVTAYLIFFQSLPRYYASTTEGKILAMPKATTLKK